MLKSSKGKAEDMDLLVGPVWFNDEGINGDWKWTTQLDVNFWNG